MTAIQQRMNHIGYIDDQRSLLMTIDQLTGRCASKMDMEGFEVAADPYRQKVVLYTLYSRNTILEYSVQSRLSAHAKVSTKMHFFYFLKK